MLLFVTPPVQPCCPCQHPRSKSPRHPPPVGTAARLPDCTAAYHKYRAGLLALSPYLSLSHPVQCAKLRKRQLPHGQIMGTSWCTHSFSSQPQRDRNAWGGGVGSSRLGPDATLHTRIAAKMHDGTDDDALSGIWPAMRRSPGQTMMASYPPNAFVLAWGDMGALPSTR